MRMITLTKKKVKRLTAIGLLAAATAAAGVGAILTSVGTQATERQLPVYCVERGDNKISLTFDVAWENSNTQELIDILDEYDARATFFVTGDWCDRYPDDVKMFADAGHEIQNHSDVHPHVKGMNVNDLITDTKSASQKITDITGTEPTLYRAPYGEYDDTVITTIEGMGLTVIQWDVEALDIDGKPLPEPVQATGAVFFTNTAGARTFYIHAIPRSEDSRGHKINHEIYCQRGNNDQTRNNDYFLRSGYTDI